jgi:iron complex outermembrane receptor protein
LPPMRFVHATALIALFCARAPILAAGSSPDGNPLASRLDRVQVTATRFGEAVQEVPTSISIVTGEELLSRGANDLRTALGLLGGVGVAPGGDAGPASAVPGLLGLREVDDFLLLIDGVPAGGAFTPPFEAISLNNVERIEVLRGSAPVYFGTTAFAGTVNVIHYGAGRAAPMMTLTYGSNGSLAVRGAKALSTGEWSQSVSAELSRDRISDPRAGYNRAQGSYRMATEMGGGKARLDLNLLLLKQKPGSPTPVGDDGRLSTGVPVDFNQNPADAKLNTRRQQLVLGYDRPLAIGAWGTTVSLTHTRFDGVQGFLVEDGLDVPGDNAQGATQSRQLHDLYVDSHVTGRPLPWLDLTWGINELYGRASQTSASFSYRVAPDGSPPQALAAGTPQGRSSLLDWRSLLGLYVQSRIALSPDASLLAGLRWNHTTEVRRTGEDGDTVLDEKRRNTRPSGSLGAQWWAWRDATGDLDDVALYASIGNTFQPPQLDFGADAGSQPLLRPETQRSLSFGVKADGDDGRFDFDLGAFISDFYNQAVARQVDGSPVLQSAGHQRYEGVEIETSFRPVTALTLAAHASYGEARYRDFKTLVGDTQTVLDGHLLVMTPRLRAGVGIVFAPQSGWGFSLTANHTGRRYLDSPNAAAVGGFNVVDASIAYRFAHASVSLAGSNLTNRRDPILPSELGEGQFYRMSGKRVFLSVSMPL